MTEVPDLMRAARIHATGGTNQVKVETVPVPTASEGFVLVRVAAAGINPIDWKLREGMFPGPPLPFTLGQDIAGDVVTSSCGFDTGESVYAMLGMGELGAYAEYASVPASALARAPKNIAIEQAAAVPMGAITAWTALFDVAGLSAGERLLVHGAGGAVGGMAVQFAKSRGVWVAATATGDDLARLRDRGVDLVIDYKTERFEDIVSASGGVEVVLDILAGETRDRSWGVLSAGGRMVSTLGPTEPPLEAADRGVLGLPGFGASPSGVLLGDIGGMIERGTIVVDPPIQFPLARAAEAMAAVQNGTVRGKVVLVMEG